jgi:hypothetical protein
LGIAAAFLLALVVSTNVLLVASASSSLPGDKLYPMKRAMENARLSLALSERNRQVLETQLAAERREEVEEMLDRDREGESEVEGILESVAGGRWTIGGLPIRFTEQTVIEGRLAVGALAHAHVSITSDGSLIGLRVRVLSGPGSPASSAQPTSKPLLSEPADGDDLRSTPARGGSGPEPMAGEEKVRTPAGTESPAARASAQATATARPADGEQKDAPEAASGGASGDKREPIATNAPARVTDGDELDSPGDDGHQETKPSDGERKATPEAPSGETDDTRREPVETPAPAAGRVTPNAPGDEDRQQTEPATGQPRPSREIEGQRTGSAAPQLPAPEDAVASQATQNLTPDAAPASTQMGAATMASGGAVGETKTERPASASPDHKRKAGGQTAGRERKAAPRPPTPPHKRAHG